MFKIIKSIFSAKNTPHELMSSFDELIAKMDDYKG